MLARIPFWGWFLAILTGFYLVYNPLGFSMFHMWTVGDPFHLMPFKALGTLLLLSFLGVIVYGTFRTMSVLGLVVTIALLAATMWSAHTLVAFDVFSVYFWSWCLQPLLAGVITIGWQWPKIWRRTHGSVTVDDPDTPVS